MQEFKNEDQRKPRKQAGAELSQAQDKKAFFKEQKGVL